MACSYILIGFLMLVLAANVLLYQPGIQSLLSIELESSVVAGSLIDLTIVAPIIARFALRFSRKTTASLMTMGLVTARFLVPAEFFEPYNELLYAGIAAEGVIETIGIHWWLHEKSMILSFVLLVLNVYSVIFILAEIQAARLVSLEVKEGKLYVDQGLTKRVIVPIETIKELKWEASLRMEALQFIFKDFESADAQVVITLKEPVQATMFMGRKKAVMELAIRVAEPEKLKKLLGACGCL